MTALNIGKEWDWLRFFFVTTKKPPRNLNPSLCLWTSIETPFSDFRWKITSTAPRAFRRRILSAGALSEVPAWQLPTQGALPWNLPRLPTGRRLRTRLHERLQGGISWGARPETRRRKGATRRIWDVETGSQRHLVEWSGNSPGSLKDTSLVTGD